MILIGYVGQVRTDPKQGPAGQDWTNTTVTIESLNLKLARGLKAPCQNDKIEAAVTAEWKEGKENDKHWLLLQINGWRLLT